MTVVLDHTTGRPRHPEKAHRPDTPVLRKPDWIRVKAPVSKGYAETQAIVRANNLHTVCEEAGCPNIGECWEKKHATFMILGDTCTRACAFCNVKTGMPGALDPHEPVHVAEADREARPRPRGHHLGRPRRPCRWRRGPFRADHPRDPRALRRHHDRSSDAGFPAQGWRAGAGGRGAARRVQPQSRDRAVALSHRAAGRALFPFAAAVAAREGDRPHDVHQVRASWSGSARSGTKCSK